MYLSTKASCVVLRGVRLREEPLTQYVKPGGVRTLIALHHGRKTKNKPFTNVSLELFSAGEIDT